MNEHILRETLTWYADRDRYARRPQPSAYSGAAGTGSPAPTTFMSDADLDAGGRARIALAKDAGGEDDESSCDPKRPCKEDDRSDDDLCCAHGGLCRDVGHPHYDAEGASERRRRRD